VVKTPKPQRPPRPQGSHNNRNRQEAPRKNSAAGPANPGTSNPNKFAVKKKRWFGSR